MKYYLIHIIVKDLAFCMLFFLVEKIVKYKDYFFETGWWTAKEIIGTSIYVSSGVMVVNTLIFSILYFVLKKRNQIIRSFWFGVGLHVITILMIWIMLNIENRLINFWIATIASSVISGFIYKRLNSEISIEQQLRKFFGVQ